MIGDRPRVDLPRAVRGLIEARTGDAVFVVPDLRIVPGTNTAYLHPSPRYEHQRDVSLHDVEPAAWLLVSVEEDRGQRP
jgi:hypothetical protein